MYLANAVLARGILCLIRSYILFGMVGGEMSDRGGSYYTRTLCLEIAGARVRPFGDWDPCAVKSPVDVGGCRAAALTSLPLTRNLNEVLILLFRVNHRMPHATRTAAVEWMCLFIIYLRVSVCVCIESSETCDDTQVRIVLFDAQKLHTTHHTRSRIVWPE